MARQHSTERVRRCWRLAECCDRTIAWFERLFMRDSERREASRADGDLFEVGRNRQLGARP